MSRLALFLTMFLWAAWPSSGCKVPVFRYALERWAPDKHRAVVFYRGEMDRDRVEILTRPLLETSANIDVEMVDLNALTEAHTWEYEHLETIGSQPVLRLYLPLASGRQAPYWEGPLNEENVGHTLDSPVRRAVSESILSGSAATWLIVEPVNEGNDEEHHQTMLRDLLTRAESTLSLPDGVLRTADVSADGLAADGTPVEWDDVLRTPIPLKIHFPVLRVSRNDPREEIFVSMLLAISQQPGRLSTDLLAIPVFGRGRCMPGIPGSRINESTIDAACRYLCGECSCQVKDQNPGVDLLLAVDWDKELDSQLLVVERTLPPLTGIVDGPESPASYVNSRSPEMEQPRTLGRQVGITLGALLLAAVAGTVFVQKRRKV